MTSLATVLVVDDEADLRESVVTYLRLQGYTALEAGEGQQMDLVLDGTDVDIVLLDVNMPGEDGFSIARRLRAQRDLGIIMLTAQSDLVDRVVGLELGADDYLSKPFDLRELLARIRSLLRRSQAQVKPTEKETSKDARDELWVRDRDGLVRVPVADIVRIVSSKDYALLHTPSRVWTHRVTMDELERQLDPAEILRVHRSAFVALKHIESFKRASRGGAIRLTDGSVVRVGSRNLGALLSALRNAGQA